MKIDRRSFLSLGIGVAAGTTLSPLPWKVTDDLSIWTQRWPWTPVPEDGETSHVNSVCTLCPGGCGISVRKINDRAVKIEGMTDSQINDGGICILGLSGLQLLYGPTRIRSPLKRMGKRGSGKWEPISWEQAISTVVQKLDELRSQERPHAVACISGQKNGTVAELLKRFLTTYGSPNFMHVPSIQDSYELTLSMMNGVQAMAGIDVENAGYVLSFSSGTLEGWGSPVRMFKANSKLRDNKGKMVQIESRLSNTAAKADKWIPINPGTEADLALGLAYVIVQEALYSRKFVENYSAGFNQFKAFVINGYSPNKVANNTGVDSSIIIALARDFAKAANPLAICGRGQGDTPGPLAEFVAVHALNALVGNINQKGGIWSLPEPNYIRWPAAEPDETAKQGLREKRIDGAGNGAYSHTRSLLNRFPEALNSQKGDAIKVLLVSAANPLYTLPDTKSIKKAIDKIPFVISFSSYMDETARYSDLLLPNHTYLERFEDVVQPAGFHQPYIGLSKPVVKPLYLTRHTGDVVIAMARALKGNISRAFPWKSYDECLKQTLGAKLNSLMAKGYWIDEKYTPPTWAKAFKKTSKKFEFTLTPFKQPTRVLPKGDASTFPLLLIPYDSVRLANDRIGDPPFMIKTVEDTVLKGKDVFVEVNPKTAEELKLAEGKTAVLTTPTGKANVKIHLFDGIRPGIIAMPKGLGHNAYDKFLAEKGINVNDLISPVEDATSGLDAAWGIRAMLSKL